MALILTCLPDATLRRHIDDALKLSSAGGARHDVEHCDGPGRVDAALRARAVDLVVFTPFGHTPNDNTPPIWASRYCSTAFLGFGDLQGCDPGVVLSLVDAGIQFLPVGEAGQRARLVSCIDKALTDSTVAHLLDRTLHLAPPELRPFWQRLARATRFRITPTEAAELYHGSERTLRRRFQDAGLPPLHRLLAWMRLYYAARLLGDPGRSAENVAAVLGFASVNALRNQVGRYLGVTTLRSLRERVAAEGILDSFCCEHARADGSRLMG
jgi:AraC-like DNA-binding protein